MDEEKLPPHLERQLLDAFEQAALRDFPNPDRVGCPGTEFLRTLATDRSSVSVRDPRLDHVTHCSPCFTEFARFRAEAGTALNRRRLVLTAAATVVLALGTVGYVQRGRLFHGQSADGYVAAEYSLRDDSVVRGAEGAQAGARKSEPRQLPREKLDLTITLPFGSDDGEYEVEVLAPDGRRLQGASGKARVLNGDTILKVKIDLSSLQQGHYNLGVRRARFDWGIHPVVVR
jgi:hypothetical protein